MRWSGMSERCPLYPSFSTIAMSALCQKRTLRGAANCSLFDHLVGGSEQCTLALQRRVDDGETLLVLLEGDIGDAEHFTQLIVRHLHRTRRGRAAGRRLWERRRTRRMERYIAFDLLNDLVDVAVEHRHRAELL